MTLTHRPNMGEGYLSGVEVYIAFFLQTLRLFCRTCSNDTRSTHGFRGFRLCSAVSHRSFGFCDSHMQCVSPEPYPLLIPVISCHPRSVQLLHISEIHDPMLGCEGCSRRTFWGKPSPGWISSPQSSSPGTSLATCEVALISDVPSSP